MSDIQDLERIASERREAAFYLSEADQRISHFRDRDNRYAEVDAIYRGDFHVVFPDESSVVEKPKIVNMVQVALDGRVATATSVPLTYRCDAANERGQTRAQKRERIAYYYDELNNGDLLRARFYADLDACGINYKLVLPDFKTGYPCIKRLDPRVTYPDSLWSPDKDPTSIIVATKVSMAVLKGMYPEAEWPDFTTKGEQDLVPVYEWYDGSEFMKVAAIGTGKNKRGVTLGKRLSNKLGKLPIAIAARVTLDGQPRGIFDQGLGPMQAQNRKMNLLLDAAADWISSQPLLHDIENPDDYGTARPLIGKSGGNPRAGRATPDSANPQIFSVLAVTDDVVRRAFVYPEGQLGESQASIVSAAGINALNSPYTNSVAMSQRLEAASWAKVMSLCFEVDEKYLDSDEPKYISGSAAGRTFSESYKPSRDIKGDYGIRATYGANTGGDRYSTEIRMTQAVGSGLLSKRTAMENSQFVKDVVEEEKQIIKDQVLAAGLAFIQQAAANPEAPNFAPAAALLQALEGDDETIFTVLASFGSIQTGAPPQQAPTGTEAFQQASSISRGGIPGPEMNVPQVGSLPPLDELGIAI